MKLILLYVGMVLSGYALYYANMPLVLIACSFFAQATGLLLMATHPESEVPRIGFGTAFGMSFFMAMGFTPLSYSSVPVLPLILSLLGGLLAQHIFRPKPVFA